VVNVGGSGDINLRNEQLDLTFLPEPKDKSLASLNSPLYVRGTFTAPKVRPDVKKMAAKGAGALIMGILNPLLAVIPLHEEPGLREHLDVDGDAGIMTQRTLAFVTATQQSTPLAPLVA